jgi:acetyl-CoA C-acetyltransferase
MRDVSIIGIGQTAVGEHWERSLRHLAGDAVLAAMVDAGTEKAGALYAGNMLSGFLTGQEHLGTLIADFVGLLRPCLWRGKDDGLGQRRDDHRPNDGCRC